VAAPKSSRSCPTAGRTIPAMATEARGPLSGLTVVDCSTVLAGPFCTMLLGDLGADVIKVEPPEGDATRGWGPPWVGSGASRTAAYYLAVNRNKRSLRLDLRTADGAAVLRRLLERGDVLVENFRPGALERFGFGDDELERVNPSLVHLAISGYGVHGPDAGRPGYDFVVQAVAGLMSITGFPDKASGAPTKVGVAITDIATGLFAAVSILAALVGRRDNEGGQRIDISLVASTLALLVNQAQNAFVTGRAPGRRGNAHPNIVPYDTFSTADGEIAVAVGSERQWPRFCEAIGAPEVAKDPRFATNGDRVEHRDELQPLLAERIAQRPSAEWLRALDAADVPCGPINDILTAFEMASAKAAAMRVSVRDDVLGSVDQVGIPFELSRTPASIRSAPPWLGQHSDEILAELGYNPADVKRFRDAGVV
jgi:crotonobetainyl-CoA:carnitine CoA-transferase CaiB-like acyl-CoA transferase